MIKQLHLLNAWMAIILWVVVHLPLTVMLLGIMARIPKVKISGLSKLILPIPFFGNIAMVAIIRIYWMLYANFRMDHLCLPEAVIQLAVMSAQLGNADGWICLIDETGNLRGELSLGSSNSEVFNSVVDDLNNQVIAVGDGGSQLPLFNGGKDEYLVKLRARVVGIDETEFNLHS